MELWHASNLIMVFFFYFVFSSVYLSVHCLCYLYSKSLIAVSSSRFLSGEMQLFALSEFVLYTAACTVKLPKNSLHDVPFMKQIPLYTGTR